LFQELWGKAIGVARVAWVGNCGNSPFGGCRGLFDWIFDGVPATELPQVYRELLSGGAVIDGEWAAEIEEY